MPRGNDDRTAGSVESAPEQAPGAVLEQPGSPRAAEMRRERRRRVDGDLDRMGSMKLAIPTDIQERMRREGKVVRWVMDTGLHDAHSNDWDRVEGVEPVQANPREGTDERLILCSKFADWDADDRKRDDLSVDAIEQRTMAGQIQGEGASSAGLVIPEGQTNRVQRQRGL